MVARKPLQGCHERGVNYRWLLLFALLTPADLLPRTQTVHENMEMLCSKVLRRCLHLKGLMLCMTRHHLFNPVACKCSCGELPELSAPVAKGSKSPRGFIIRDHVASRPAEPNRWPWPGGMACLVGHFGSRWCPGLPVVLELCFSPAVRAHKNGSQGTGKERLSASQSSLLQGGQRVSWRSCTSLMVLSR